MKKREQLKKEIINIEHEMEGREDWAGMVLDLVVSACEEIIMETEIVGIAYSDAVQEKMLENLKKLKSK